MIALLLAPAALASACCAGATSDVPATLGRCEKAAVALSVGSAIELGRWNGESRWTESSDGWTEGRATLAAAYRWARWGQVGVGLPFLLNDRFAGELSSSGGGVGDASVSLRFDPIEEARWPTPIIDLGLVLPTGRDWTASQDPLLADVTGEGLWQPWLGLGFEHTLRAWPVRARLSYRGLPGAPTARLGGSLGVGRYFGTHWTVAGSWSAEYRPGGGNFRNGLDLSLVYGQPLAWRAWVSAGSDLPAPGLGRDEHGEARVSLGVLLQPPR